MNKNWLITHNNPKMTLQEYMAAWEKDVVYMNAQLEKGKEGTPHIQAYVSLKRNQRLSYMRKRDSHAHFEPVQKDNGASKYCLKEETRLEGPFEFGTRPVNRASKQDWEDHWENAKKGNLEEIPADIRIRCYNQLKRIEKDHQKVSGEADDCKGIWVWGESGCGKSRWARDNYPETYKKLANRWWDGYQGDQYVLLEDLDPNHSMLGYHIKLWGDRYHTIGETKGGQVELNFEKIIITS